jgi:hypothetical protein
VNAVQTASANPAQAAALANADACELLESDDAVLACWRAAILAIAAS